MSIETIAQIISTIPEAGHRGVDVQTVFVNKQEDFQDHLQGTTVSELNTLKTQINTTVAGMNDAVTNVNTKASEAATSALNASNSANTATTKANEASASASQALTSRNQAGTFAQQAQASATSIDVNNLVHKTGDESIAGTKTFSSTIVGSINGNSATASKAATLAQDGNTANGGMIFNWSGQGGQPSWLWGGSDGTNMYVYNPSNFSVNYANSATYAATAAVGTNDTQIATTAFVQANKTAVNATAVGTATAGLSVGSIGSYAFLMRNTVNTTFIAGNTYAGSGLYYTGVNNETSAGSYAYTGGIGTVVSGTWRAMGTCLARSDRKPSTLFLRIA